MPIVFVHGVATRLEPRYWRDLEARKMLMRAFLYPALGIPEAKEPRFAFWGAYGAQFRWGHASLPSRRTEQFGEADGTLKEVVSEYAELDAPADAFVGSLGIDVVSVMRSRVRVVRVADEG